jgi:adenylate cyclase
VAESNKSSELPAVPAPSTSVWARIKDHKIAQWTLAYAAAAYALLDGTKILSEAFDWPHLIIRVVAALLILGLPLVVTLAWYHGHRALHRVSGTELMIIALLLAIGGSFLWRDSKKPYAGERATSVVPAPPAASIAVLAFSDLSAEGDQGYFSDGIAEEILNVLAHVNGLKVASRTSSFQFRKAYLGAPIIAQRLGVRYVLEGSVRKAGDTVRITAQLIDATTDQHVWSQTFDRPLNTANLFAIQDEIARSIVEHLATVVGDAASVGKLTARKADTADAEAYDLYLKGHALFVARTPTNLIEATRILKAAVTKDPKFARAWETLGAVLLTSKYWGIGETSDWHAGVDAAETALRLDPNLSMAYAVLGGAQSDMTFGGMAFSWEDALGNYSRAIANDGKNATAFLWRGEGHASLGYLDRAIQDYQRCLEIDPAYAVCRQHIEVAYLFLGRSDEALRLYELGLEAGDVNDDLLIARVIAARGDRLAALRMLATAGEYGQSQLIRPLIRALTDPKFDVRDRQEALAIVETARKNTAKVDAAVPWIFKGYDEIAAVSDGEPPIWWARDDAEWLKSPSRKQLMERWRLPEYWRKHGFPPQCKPRGETDFECR